MQLDEVDSAGQQALEQIAGYLNFSSGAKDPRLAQSLNELYRRLEPDGVEADDTAARLADLLQAKLSALRETSPAFERTDQADAVLQLAFTDVLPAYRLHHRDLLFHQTDAVLWRPFFLAHVFSAVLSAGEPFGDRERIVAEVLAQLNDFIGHRPVAVLRTAQKIEPYGHERVCPVPLHLAGAGVAVGRYQALIEGALEILADTDPALLDETCFEMKLLDELAVDPRAYDFDHPVSKRPNYLFGQWDPHRIDEQGHYRRFVLQQITLDGLLERINQCDGMTPDEALFEGAAVLAGVILMAACISGRGPDTHDSATSLTTLVPHIARYRDIYYQQLLARLEGSHAERLRRELDERKEPFAGARHHLNRYLARCRAAQLEHVHVARLYAQMGYAEAARREASIVPAASARIQCEIDCSLTAAQLAIDHRQLDHAEASLAEAEDWLHRGIECGALVDPWNILGFQGNFSLFRAIENSVHDHRVDELIAIMEQIFALYARLAGAQSATGSHYESSDLEKRLTALAEWWDNYPTQDIEGVEHISGYETCESARHVAQSLQAWRAAGVAAGDVVFWRPHVARFASPKAYALVIEALLDEGDHVASMALLMQWLNQSEDTPLEDGEFSFHRLATRWMDDVTQAGGDLNSEATPRNFDEAIALACKFLDHFEASAEAAWDVPRFELAVEREADVAPARPDVDEDDENDGGGLFDAAYEGMTYRDSTADGWEGELLEEGPAASDFELDHEARRLASRLGLLRTTAMLWSTVAPYLLPHTLSSRGTERDPYAARLEAWRTQARRNQEGLLRLLRQVHGYRVARRGTSQIDLLEYDRLCRVQQWILERVIDVYVETSAAARAIACSQSGTDTSEEKSPAWHFLIIDARRALFQGDKSTVEKVMERLTTTVRKQQLLYQPLTNQRDPTESAATHDTHRALHELASELPRLGLYGATCRLIAAAHAAERENPLGPGAVTQFDRLFEAGFLALVEGIARSAASWTPPRDSAESSRDATLVECLESLTDRLLALWLEHSRSMRLSALEPLADANRWRKLKRFIERYGAELFTQDFFNPGNLRAILDHGAESYLAALEERDDSEGPLRLLEDLDGKISRSEAARHITVVCEAIIENYTEYGDYNSTTTQSDRGELLYVLLDFLRLSASYERISWNLMPLTLAHEVLIRRNHAEAAELWRRTLAEKTQTAADRLIQDYENLCAKYGVRLATVGDRLGERFVQPLALDRIRALIQPAIDDARRGEASDSFELLDQEITELTRQPTGAGLDIPDWLAALEDEVDRLHEEHATALAFDEDAPPWITLPLDDVRRQIEEWDRDT